MDDEDNFDPTGDSTEGTDDRAGAPAPNTNDGQLGAPVPGSPGLRAGMPGGEGVLQLWRSGDDASSAANLVPAAYFSKGQDVLPDYQTQSWRWHDPQALAFDQNRKQGQVGQVQGMALGLDVLGGLSLPINPWVSRGIAAGSAALGYGEASHLQNQADALKARQQQLKDNAAFGKTLRGRLS